MPGRLSDSRGISPVVGVALLVAIVTILAGTSAYYIFALSDQREPQPDVKLDMEVADDGIVHRLVHEQGNRLDGDKVRLRGVAESDALAGTELAAGQKEELLPMDEKIRVVYEGEHGTTYTLATFEAERTVPEPDQGCSWVDSETNGGNDPITIDDTVVNCDVETADGVTVQNDGVVIGQTDSDTKTLEGVNAEFYGDVEAEKVVKLDDGTRVRGDAASQDEEVKVLQNSVVTGDVQTNNDLVDVKSGGEVQGSISATETVTVEDGSVGGSVDTDGQIKIISGSSVDGGLENGVNQIRVYDGSVVSGDVVSDGEVRVESSGTVEGSIATDGSVNLDDATVEGDVYVDDVDFSCSSSTINGRSCAAYSPKDPTDY